MSPADAIAIRQTRRARVRTIRRRVIAGAVALFVAVWLLITLMLVTGHDPALASQATTTRTTAQTTSSSTGSTGSNSGTAGSNSGTASSNSGTASSNTGTSSSSGGTSSVTSRQS